MLNSTSHNPDVLSCLANLSNDEVFTPPQLVNQILDLLPKELWSDTKVTFLDPVCKSGVFLREIAKRLDAGLEKQIPDRQKRLNHIFKNQVFGLAITELTSLLSRRSVYCTKTADGKYSVCDSFDSPEGNIGFKPIKHQWNNGKCKYCGASDEVYSRGDELESHAYQFIHTDKPEEIFNMKFDVIVGNPPYQLNDGGFGKSAAPIYHYFVQQAKKLNPRFLTMIIPSRWFAGGKGLDQFRQEMLNDGQMRKLIDFADASECFPGVDIAGGVCYFLWARGTHGNCEVINKWANNESSAIRPLNEFETLIRDGSAVGIIRKVLAFKEPSMGKQVSSRKPFGLATNVRPEKTGDLVLRWNGGVGPFQKINVSIGQELIECWKVMTSKVSYDHGGQPDKNGMRRVLSIVDILPPNAICTETYILAGCFDNEAQAQNLAAFLRTKFVRFLISQMSFSQDITKERFCFVPVLDSKIRWTDQSLYERYQLTAFEVGYIESKIRPMESADE